MRISEFCRNRSPVRGVAVVFRRDASDRRNEVRIEPQMVMQVPGDQESFQDTVVPGPPHRTPSGVVSEKFNRPRRCVLNRGDEEAVTAVLDLDADTTNIPPDDGDPLPQRLAHDETEPFPKGFRQG